MPVPAIPNVQTAVVTQHEVRCDECGPILIVPEVSRNSMFAAQRARVEAEKHRDVHRRKASPIFEILEAWEDLKENVGSWSHRTKQGVELHLKVEDAITARLNDPAADPEIVAQLNEINDWLLYEVFKLDPKAKRGT